MTKEQYNILAAELEKRGYKKYMQSSYLGEDWGYFKSPKKDKSDNSLFQIKFTVHDFERIFFNEDDAFSVNVQIRTSPISDKKRYLCFGYGGQPIDDIEKIAASFYEWCENNFNK
nr:MAG TPA: hypothetical protein [Crassvirales sp.]